MKRIVESVHFEKNFTDLFIEAMRTWKKPGEKRFGSEELRIESEKRIQVKLADLKLVTALAVQNFLMGARYDLFMKVGSFHDTKDCLKHEVLYIFENYASDHINTQINWLKSAAKMEMVTLREVDGNPWKIKELFEQEREI